MHICRRLFALLVLFPSLVQPHDAEKRVGLLVQGPTSKGLFRDAECLMWALNRAPVRLGGSVPQSVSFFFTQSYALLDKAIELGASCIGEQTGRRFCTTPEPLHSNDSHIFANHVTYADEDFRLWIQNIDVLVVFESLLVNVLKMAHTSGCASKILVLNIDWTDGEKIFEAASAIPGIRFWVKGSASLKHIKSMTTKRRLKRFKLDLVPWSIPDPVIRSRATPGKVIRLIFIAGYGGIYNRRGGDIVLKAYHEAYQKLKGQVKLSYFTARNPQDYDIPVDKKWMEQPNLEMHIGNHRRETLWKALLASDVVLYPSRWEGLGLSLLEALHAGIPAIVTDGWPMNELVQHDHNGILVPANQTGWFHMAPQWEVDPSSLASAIVRVATSRKLLRRLTCPSPGELLARQHHFIMKARQIILGEPRAKIVSFSAGPHTEYLRAEYFRSDAFRKFGYEVVEYSYSDDLRNLSGKNYDFAIVAKAPHVQWVSYLKSIFKSPVFMWFWDPIDYGEERRRWFEEIAPMFQAVILNEKGRENMWAARGLEVHYVEEGIMLQGDRGPGRRPTFDVLEKFEYDVSFQGTVYPYPPDVPRVSVLLSLNRSADAELAIFGPEEMWRSLNLTSRGRSYGAQSRTIHRNSKISLSLSRLQRASDAYHLDVELYRSERFMDGAASGACVLSENFPGVDIVLPRDAVLIADSQREYLEITSKIVADPDACRHQRLLAEASAWSYHTWHDSVGKFLSLVTHKHDKSKLRHCYRRAGEDCCSSEHYNLNLGMSLMGWLGTQEEEFVTSSLVEGGVYFWAAIRDCPSNILAWENIAISFMAQRQFLRAVRCQQTSVRLRGEALRTRSWTEEAQALSMFQETFGRSDELAGCEAAESGGPWCREISRISLNYYNRSRSRPG